MGFRSQSEESDTCHVTKLRVRQVRRFNPRKNNQPERAIATLGQIEVNLCVLGNAPSDFCQVQDRGADQNEEHTKTDH